jgi:hypothetical protein
VQDMSKAVIQRSSYAKAISKHGQKVEWSRRMFIRDLGEQDESAGEQGVGYHAGPVTSQQCRHDRVSNLQPKAPSSSDMESSNDKSPQSKAKIRRNENRASFSGAPASY